MTQCRSLSEPGQAQENIIPVDLLAALVKYFLKSFDCLFFQELNADLNVFRIAEDPRKSISIINLIGYLRKGKEVPCKKIPQTRFLMRSTEKLLQAIENFDKKLPGVRNIAPIRGD